MAISSKIEWTNATWNPWSGCKKVSAGCKFCYMYRDKLRYKHDPTIIKRSSTTFTDPLRWQKNGKLKPGDKIFTCSWSDFFIEDADEWREDAWRIIRETPEFNYLILTKRPERIKDHLPIDWGSGYDNVWLGVSIENQKTADERLPILPNLIAKNIFVSVEPLLGPIKIREPQVTIDVGAQIDAISPYDWVIIGGESGNENGDFRYRECELDWIKNILSEIEETHNVFIKQLGTYLARKMGLRARHGNWPQEWPVHLQKQELPDSFNGEF